MKIRTKNNLSSNQSLIFLVSSVKNLLVEVKFLSKFHKIKEKKKNSIYFPCVYIKSYDKLTCFPAYYK